MRSNLDVRELILELRPDLRLKFQRNQRRDHPGYLEWILLSGLREYRALHSEEFLHELFSQRSKTVGLTRLQELVWQARSDVRHLFPLPESLSAYQDWFFRHAVGEHSLWRFLSAQERGQACQLDGPWRGELIQQAIAELSQSKRSLSIVSEFGVNVIGYVHGQFGIAEDVRMAVSAFDAVQIPVAILNFRPGADMPQSDMSIADRVVTTGSYSINLFCLTALEHGRFFAERGLEQIEQRYNIGYWPWELSQWPREWAELVHLVDEVWVSSEHTLHAVLPHCNALNPTVPVRLMPMAVPAPPEKLHAEAMQQRRLETRQQFGLPATACLFCFSFDLNSSIHRKNPEAVVKAFLSAFPVEGKAFKDVGLVIKVHPPKEPHPAWDRLKAAAVDDERLHVIEATLPQRELLALYQACDCFVSLHRAEGFGRGIAEALQLGLRVITTDYSGNVAFCRRPEFADRVKLVPYRLVKVRPGQYPYGQGQVWANADARAAADAMRKVAIEVHASEGKLLPVPHGGWPVFSPDVVGKRYLRRLREIWAVMQGSDHERVSC